jgi:hypothetical protein
MNTSDLLASIESKASWLEQDARMLIDFVCMLAIRRDFPTKAEAAMDIAKTALLQALKDVRTARTYYLAKPTQPNSIQSNSTQPESTRHETLRNVSI